MLTVQKFGGTSVADAERLRRAAETAAEAYERGDDVVVVLSARGDTTDDLLELAAEISDLPAAGALDLLLTTGEQISVALMAMCLERMGYKAHPLTGWQVAVKTDDTFGNARILQVETETIRRLLRERCIVLVTGYQGVTDHGAVTTLGRGGSDTTAVALAAALQADRCQIFTDVDGIYTKDPRKFPDAEKYDEITYDQMLKLIEDGAQVLHDRSVLLARDSGVVIEVLSSFEKKQGTLVR